MISWSLFCISLLFASPLIVQTKRRHSALQLGESSRLQRDGGYVRCPDRPTDWKRVLGRRRCRKTCTTDDDCGQGRKRCLCDGQCGWSCINPASRCSAVIDLVHGYSRLPRDFVFNSIAEFGCDPGYLLHGDPVRRCQGDRKWSGKEPTCRIKASDCGPPHELPYAEHDAPLAQTSFPLDTLLHYTCVPGYFAVKGLPKSKCLLYNGTARWFGPDNEFKCSARSCGNPGDLLNGMREGKIFEYPHTVKYMCVGGFELLGSAIRKCQANGKWSGDKPYCKPVECAKPDEPLHGNVVGTSLEYQARITYTCKDGFRLVGQAQRVCQSDRAWTGQEPICEQIRCPPLGPLWNGYLQGDGTSFETVVMFRCLEGMSQLGAPYTKCLRDGTWSHQQLPKCMAPCPIPKIEHGRVAKWNASQMVLHGERVQVECDDNHEAAFPQYPLCHNGTWSHIPRCIPVRCKTWPPNVRDARVVFSKTDHNSAAKYECSPGYELKGNSIIYCMFGQWTRPLPKCQEKICPHPSELVMDSFTGGTILLHGTMGAYKYAKYIRSVTEGRQIVYQCHQGYRLYGPPRATCVDGSWSPGVKPRCIPKTHPKVEGKIAWNTGNARIRRKRSVTASRMLNHSIRRRRRQKLRKLRAGENQQMKYRRIRNKQMGKFGFLGGSSDRFLEPNFDVDDAINDQEKQVGTQPRKLCPNVYENVRQQIAVIKGEKDESGLGFSEGSQLMVLCKPGFKLPNQHDGSMQCLAGQWYPPVPQCNPKKCVLPERVNSYYTFQSQIAQPGKKVAHGEAARLNCLQHFTLIGHQDTECYLGRFIKVLGQCIPNSCDVPFIRYGFYEMSPLPQKISHGSEIRFTCQREMHPSPSNSYVACDHGYLRPHVPTCNPEESGPSPPQMPFGCPRPANIEQAWVYRHQVVGNHTITTMIDPYQDVYPNNTLVHFKCAAKDLDHQATAVKCIHGEWFSQLHFKCANSHTPPVDVDSQSEHIKRLQVEGDNQSCSYPPLPIGTLILNVNHTNSHIYPHASKLQIVCEEKNVNESGRVWRIKCRKGIWKDVGHIKCTPRSKTASFSSREVAPYGSCLLSPIKHANVRFFVTNKGTVVKVAEHVADGSVVEARCIHVGMYLFSGSKRLVCSKGQWIGDLPKCYQLSPFANESGPPGVMYRVKSGNVAETNTGQLVVRRSSDLLLECLYPKNLGQPTWETSTSYRAYPQSWQQVTLSHPWTQHATKVDSYRLTVDVIQYADSGIYYCIAPTGHRQTIFIKVMDIKCPSSIIAMAKTRGIKMEISGANKSGPFYMGTSIKFTCTHGYKLNGESTVYCLETQEWSQTVPACEPIECPVLRSGHPALSMQVTGTSVNSAAKFMCSAGYTVSGPSHIHCTTQGVWSDPNPTCVVVTCRSPDLPAGLSIKQAGGVLTKPKINYSHGDVLLFSCQPGSMMAGRDFVVCDQHGNWDNPSPECLAYCRYPGRPVHGDSTVSQKDYYLVGERLVYYCAGKQYSLQGTNVLECMSSGLWDNQLPTCKSTNQNNDDTYFEHNPHSTLPSTN